MGEQDIGRALAKHERQNLSVVFSESRMLTARKEFYKKLGWRLDFTPPIVVQFTPPGSWCSVQFGKTLTSAAPGSARAYLIVSDIEAARSQLVAAGVEVSEFFHIGPGGLVSGLDPERRQLLLPRVVQRPRRQRLVAARGYEAVSLVGSTLA